VQIDAAVMFMLLSVEPHQIPPLV